MELDPWLSYHWKGTYQLLWNSNRGILRKGLVPSLRGPTIVAALEYGGTPYPFVASGGTRTPRTGARTPGSGHLRRLVLFEKRKDRDK